MKRIGSWLLMMTKRLYKKLTFLLILLLIPVLVLGYGVAAREDSGVLTIALAQEGADPMAQAVMADLINTPSVIRYVPCETAAEAEAMISGGKADAAWIFAADMTDKVCKFVQNPARRNAFVRVVEQEATIPLKLAREKLSGVVFGHCSPKFYLEYIRANVPELDSLSDEELLAFYDGFADDIKLFEFAYLDGEGGEEDIRSANYLLTPVRGLLAVIVVLSGLAAAMYYIRDDRMGTFSLVPQQNKAAVEFSCQMIAVINVAVVALIALICAGLAVNLGRELLILVLYALTVSVFCMTVRRLCQSLAALGTALPLLVVVMLVCCPVFFDFGELRSLQYLFPPTYYINAAVSNRFLLLMVGYSLVLLVIYTLTGKLLRRK